VHEQPHYAGMVTDDARSIQEAVDTAVIDHGSSDVHEGTWTHASKALPTCGCIHKIARPNKYKQAGMWMPPQNIHKTGLPDMAGSGTGTSLALFTILAFKYCT
jgi:hypothetical protein